MIESIWFQVAGFIILTIITITFYTTNRLKSLSDRVFEMLLVVAYINIFLEIMSMYTKINMKDIAPWIMVFVQQIFILSKESFFYIIAAYIFVIHRGQRKLRKKSFTLVSFIFLVSIIFGVVNITLSVYNVNIQIIFKYMRLEYFDTVAFLLIVINLVCYFDREMVGTKNLTGVFISSAIWVGITSMQLFFPAVYSSTHGEIVTILCLYLSRDGMYTYVDPVNECFNQWALRIIMGDFFTFNKKFNMVMITVDNLPQAVKRIGKKRCNQLIQSITEEIRMMYKSEVYYCYDNVFVVIPKMSKKKLMKRANIIYDTFYSRWECDGICEQLHSHIDILECPSVGKSSDDIFGLMEVLKDTPVPGQPLVNMVTGETIRKKKRRNSIRARLVECIMQERVEIVYQPIYDTHTGTYPTGEALVRLVQDPGDEYVSPDEFIRIAEEEALISNLGQVIFKKICIFCAENRLWEKGVKYMDVNLSGIQMCDRNLPERLGELMDEYEVPPEFINFEITETAAAHSEEVLWKNMKELKALGCSFSMDDFGTGYANLSQVVSKNFDIIKIDKSLLWPCFENKETKPKVVFEGIVSMFLRLGSQVLVEGVETQDQMNYLVKLGIDYLQGYFFSKPLSESDYINFITIENGIPYM